MKKLAKIHPDEILLYEFLELAEITAYQLPKDLKIPQTHISEIIKGNRRITEETALRLSSFFGNSPNFRSDCKMILIQKKKLKIKYDFNPYDNTEK